MLVSPAMSEQELTLIATACAVGGALLGLILRGILPEAHLSGESRDAVKVGTGFISTLAALVLGLLISSAKSSFDSMSQGFTETGAKIIDLDRLLVAYGPETRQARDLMRRGLAARIALIWPEQGAGHANEDGALRSAVGMETVQAELIALSPRNEQQTWLKSQALEMVSEMAQLRWLLFEESRVALPMTLLVILLFWLAVIFIGFGLLVPRNATVVAILVLSALSAAGAIFLILELNHPLSGWIQVSSDPLRRALAVIGR